MAPKKNVKMDLGSFLADDTFGGGSWADEEVDLNSISVSLDQPKFSTAAPINTGAGSGTGVGSGSGSNFSGASGNDEFRRERKEFPIPDQPPYRARVSNLPWEADEDTIVRHFEDRMQAKDIITDIALPKDRETGRLRGFAFITFTEREILEESLNLSMSEFQGRKIYVNVAAPPKAEDGDWRSGRSASGGNMRREPAPELDWGAARNSQANLPVRERPTRTGSFTGGEGRPPRRQEPDLDWGSARGAQAELPPRQRSNRNTEGGAAAPRTPRRQEPELDWGSARGTQAELPPRQRSNRSSEGGVSSRPPRKQEPELDWGSARGTQSELPPRQRSNRTNNNNNHTDRKPSEPDFDWRRGQSLPSRKSATNVKKEEKKAEQQQQQQQQGPQKSHFSVLDVEGDEESEEEEKPSSQVKDLEEATANLSVSNDANEENDDGWEVVKK